jgi:Uma2 family endonuclease
MADYAFIGVPELWLFYSEKRRFEAYVLESGTYQLKPTELSARIDLDKLWRAFYGHGQE